MYVRDDEYQGAVSPDDDHESTDQEEEVMK